MFKSFSLSVAVMFAIAVIGVSSTNAQMQEFPVGNVMEDFTLQDIYGKEHSFKSLHGKNGAVLIFLSAQCPVVKQYDDRVNALAAEYAAKGITFVGINSNSTEGLDWVKSHAEANYKFPMLLDPENKIADKLGATVTPEVYFFDTNNKLLYHGAIDNDRTARNIKDTYLKAAFDTTLSGGTIERTKANAFGCTIKRVGME
jgi:peroxiredoxin